MLAVAEIAAVALGEDVPQHVSIERPRQPVPARPERGIFRELMADAYNIATIDGRLQVVVSAIVGCWV